MTSILKQRNNYRKEYNILMEYVEQIEKMTDSELIDSWKGLVWLNCIYGQVSLNDMQRIDLIELEIDERPKINSTELSDWFEDKTINFTEEQ